jgi:sensor domain CHASE-containing protein
LLIVGATLCGIIGLLYVVASTLLLEGFLEVERQDARQNLQRSQDALSHILGELNSAAADWAAWDATYQFVQDGNERYIEANLGSTTFTSFRLNFMLIIDASGRIVLGQGFDLENHRAAALPRGLTEHLSPSDPLLSHASPEDSLAGILRLPEASLLVATCPITNTDRQSPIRGTLIFGRYLSAAEIRHLASLVHLDLDLHRFEDPHMPADVAAAQTSLSASHPTLIREVSKSTIAGYTLLHDIYGKPALVLRATMPRNISRQGRRAIHSLVLILAIMGPMLVGANLWLIEGLVLSRLTRLSGEVRDIAQIGRSSCRIAADGADELGSLAGAINDMLNALEHSQREMRASEERLKRVLEGSNDGFWDWNVATGEMNLSPRGAEMLGYRLDEIKPHVSAWEKWVHPNRACRHEGAQRPPGGIHPTLPE